MIVRDLLDKNDDELAAMLKEIDNEPIEWTPVILAELTRRSVGHLREETERLHSSSRRLEALTRWLIVLTVVLGALALPPAYEVLKRLLTSQPSGQTAIAQSTHPSETSGWLYNGPVPMKGSITYTSDAMFESDIPLPKIEDFRASVKLVQPPTSPSFSARVVAYKAAIRVAGLQRKDIPAKYLREVLEQHKGGPTTTLPLEQVTYVGQLKFALLDADGFVLAEVSGPEEWFESGTTNQLQHITTESISGALANRVVKIRPSFLVIRCESCRTT